MNKLVTRVSLWTVAVCLLIALIVPKTPAGQHAIKGLIVGIVVLALLSVFELICVFRKTTPDSTWRPGNSDQAEGRLHRDDDGWTDDLVDGTAMGLIDWDE